VLVAVAAVVNIVATEPVANMSSVRSAAHAAIAGSAVAGLVVRVVTVLLRRASSTNTVVKMASATAPAMATMQPTAATAKLAPVRTTNVTTHTVVAMAAQVSNLAASAAVVADSVIAPTAVAPPADADEPPTPALTR